MSLDWTDYLKQIATELETDKGFRDGLLSLKRRYILYCHSTVTENREGLKTRQNSILANSSSIEDLKAIKAALSSVNIHFSFIYDKEFHKIVEVS